MNKSVFHLCLTGAVSFIAGMVVMLVGSKLWDFQLERVNRSLGEKAAYAFFYDTMQALLEDTYNTEDDSVDPEALKTFREYESRLGDKFLAYFSGYSGYYTGIAFFPSGDFFDFVVIRDGDRWVLKYFSHNNWELYWRNLPWVIEYDKKQRSKEPQ